MTDKQIQALIDRYLDGETSPEEELQLARVLPPTHPVSIMLGELTRGEAEYESIMAEREQATLLAGRHRRTVWLRRAVVLAVAASVVLAVVLVWRVTAISPTDSRTAQQLPLESEQADVQTLAQPTIEDAVAELTQPSLPEEKAMPATTKPARKHVATTRSKPAGKSLAAAAAEIPDTLGQGIWQDKDNVLLALKMLSECEETIERSEQRLRNDLVEATFTALPQRPQARLVIYDNGDYMVVDDSKPQIIEL